MYSIIRRIYYYVLNQKRNRFMQGLINHGLQLGHNVSILQGCFLDPPHCFLISIGDNCTLAPGVRLIAHDASTKRKLGYTKIGRIEIGRDCFIGDSTIILPGVRIGPESVIGAGSVVTENIPSGSVAAGNPCKVICSSESFFQRAEKNINDRKAPYSELPHSMLTPDQKQEVIGFLEKSAGYIR
jgi:maltose O-acetyltransferase